MAGQEREHQGQLSSEGAVFSSTPHNGDNEDPPPPQRLLLRRLGDRFPLALTYFTDFEAENCQAVAVASGKEQWDLRFS